MSEDNGRDAVLSEVGANFDAEEQKAKFGAVSDLEKQKQEVYETSLTQEVSPDLPILNIVGSAGEAWTTISNEDIQLRTLVADIMDTVKDAPSVKRIATVINDRFPINPVATQAVRQIRREVDEGRDPLPLGDYFQPGEGYPYAAVCMHKTLLGQAVASQYGIDTSIVSFMFNGQVKDGADDNIPGMHAALEYSTTDGEKRIADAHKRIDLPVNSYWKRFINHMVYSESKTFAPVSPNNPAATAK